MLLPPFIFPPVAWFIQAAKNNQMHVAMGGFYEKQTYRNRYAIAGSNQIQNLTIPVQHTGEKKLLRDAKIDFAENWKKQHLKSLQAAYGKAPFYEFYDYRILPLFDGNNPLLAHFIEQSIRILHKLLLPEISLTFTHEIGLEIKLPDCPKYPQVFDDKCGFRGNLSALDLLFNLGPEAEYFLLNAK